MTNTELWNIALDYQNTNTHFPTPQELSEKTAIKRDILHKVYMTWAQKGLLTLKQGIFQQVSNTTIDNTTIETVHEQTIQRQLDTPKKCEQSHISEEAHTHSYRQLITITICSTVALALLACSVHFTYTFNRLAMRPIWAFLLSFAIVGFTSFAFVLADNFRKLTAFMTIILWAIGISYSIFTAIAGQYDAFRSYVSQESTSVTEMEYAMLSEQRMQLEQRRQALLPYRDQELLYNGEPTLKRNNPGTWNSITAHVAELRSVEDELDDVSARLVQAVQDSRHGAQKRTIYSWLGQLLHVHADIIQFIVILFPSVFIDLVTGIVVKYIFSVKMPYNTPRKPIDASELKNR